MAHAYLIVICEPETNRVLGAEIWSSPEWEQSRCMDKVTYVLYHVEVPSHKYVDARSALLRTICNPLVKRYHWVLKYLEPAHWYIPPSESEKPIEVTHEQMNAMAGELTHQQLNALARRIKHPHNNPLCSVESLQRLVQDATELANWIHNRVHTGYEMRPEHFDVVSKYPVEKQIEFLRWSVENQANAAELAAYAQAMSEES